MMSEYTAYTELKRVFRMKGRDMDITSAPPVAGLSSGEANLHAHSTQVRVKHWDKTSETHKGNPRCRTPIMYINFLIRELMKNGAWISQAPMSSCARRCH